MLNKTFVTARTMFAALLILLLNACVYGVPIVSPGDVVLGAVAADALSSESEGEPIETRISGTYENGFWFDRSLYSVYVVANSAEEAKRVAYSTATDSCLKHGTPVKVVSFIDSETSNNFFVQIASDRPSYEMKFRCEEAGMEPG